MKTGLITTHYAINYGAILQAYALWKTIGNLGCDCEIINYQPRQKMNGRSDYHQFNNLRDLLMWIYKFSNLPYRRRIYLKKQKFDQFLHEKCALSKEVYGSYLELQERLLKYDCFVCGSDQIWNLNLLYDPAYFLRFEDIYPETPYIAYAPSIAEKLTANQYLKLAENIAHFSAISVRENDGAALVSKLTDQAVKNVLDPVFLLNKTDWGNIANPMPVKEPYILLYSVAGDNNYTEVVKKIRKKLGYRIVCINNTVYNKYHADQCFYDASPQNFLWLVKNAEFVCTSSFHATAFSIIFEKQFFSIPSKTRSSRLESLLGQLGLSRRMLLDSASFTDNLLLKIDYSLLKQQFIELINESIDFLDTSLNGKGKRR